MYLIVPRGASEPPSWSTRTNVIWLHLFLSSQLLFHSFIMLTFYWPAFCSLAVPSLFLLQTLCIICSLFLECSSSSYCGFSLNDISLVDTSVFLSSFHLSLLKLFVVYLLIAFLLSLRNRNVVPCLSCSMNLWIMSILLTTVSSVLLE